MTWRTLLGLLLIAGCSFADQSSNREVRVSFDYGGAETLLDAVERDAMTRPEAESLLRVAGVQGMVRNVHRLLPEITQEDFVESILGWVERREPGSPAFALRHIAAGGSATRATLAAIKKREAELEQSVGEGLSAFLPSDAPSHLKAYFVVGGVSDGFVLEDDGLPAFYQAVDRAQGDIDGLILVALHELYHVVQLAARKGVIGLDESVGNYDDVPPQVRLLTVTMDEGAANFVADPTPLVAEGPYIGMFRDRYAYHSNPEQIAKNFALFDQLFADLSSGRIRWREAYEAGFSGGGPESNPLYFVGYEVAKVLNAMSGPDTIADAFASHPAEFLHKYIQFYKAGGSVPARFSSDTEQRISALIGR